MAGQNIKIELNAVIVAVTGGEPQLLIDPDMALPSGPFETGHRTLEQGLRNWAQSKGGQPLGYVEQLYTFADKDRAAGHERLVSIGYLALVHANPAAKQNNWSPWYRHFPWEDHRKGVPVIIAKTIMPGLNTWKSSGSDTVKRERSQRIGIAFPKDMRRWNEEHVLQRYELLWEAGLVEEAQGKKTNMLGTAMAHDHRRILATAMARLRAKIKYRPVVFELMPESFTLLQLQNAVEALAGLRLHKQNFRRLVETQGLVEETGAVTSGASGRPAKLFAFRREVLVERAATGTKLPRS
ncbi:MAG TPA: hypothetical protein VFR09_03415 [Alphaproteobacteria bacterium]|nr:hypothetical protein [Alphaproteobacteria bacterium]